jgi:hypothetical protein
MNLRIYLLAVAILACVSAHAQDRIYMRDGSVIEARVKSVGQSAIIYKRFDNPSGPEYTILVREVFKIVYENGTTDNFKEGASSPGSSGRSSHSKVKKKYDGPKMGNNIFTFTPVSYTVEMLRGSMKDPGFGICYERILDDRGHISIVLPVTLNFTQSSDFSSDYFSNGYYYSVGVNTTGYKSYMFAPGIKLYPADNHSKVRYSIGASLFALFGSEPYPYYDNGNFAAIHGDWHYSMYGFLVTNSVNVTLSKHLYLEVDVNGGLPVADNRRIDQTSLDGLISPITQFAMKVGARF